MASPGLTGVAQGGNWGGRSGAAGLGCDPPTLIQADNREHFTWYSANLSDRGTNAMNWVRADVYNPTVVNTPNASMDGPSTDAVIYDQFYSTFCGFDWRDIAGLVTCVSLNGADECERHEVRLDQNDTHGWMDLTERRSLACHEYGHSFGLMHRAAGCMRADDVWPTDITDHDRTHLTLLG